MAGKHPYAQQGGADISHNIKGQNFSYPLGEISNKKTPVGNWGFMWSHLAYIIKDAFYNSFARGGKFSAPGNRLSAQAWMNLMQNYHDMLKNGKLQRQDEMSLQLYPSRYKKSMHLSYVTCPCCGEEVTEELVRDGHCFYCYKKQTASTQSCKPQCKSSASRTSQARGRQASPQEKGILDTLLDWLF